MQRTGAAVLWRQFLDAVSHTVLSFRREQGGHQGRVPDAFDVFHVDIEGGDDVGRALDAVLELPGSATGVQVGVFARGRGGQKYVLLELWTMERTATVKAGQSVCPRRQAVGLRLLLRSIHAAVRLLPLQQHRAGRRGRVGFFLAPLGAYDMSSGVLHPDAGFVTEYANPISGVARFPSLPDLRRFGAVALEGGGRGMGALAVSCHHLSQQAYADAASDSFAVPSAGDPAGVSVNIIGDYYVNRPHDAVPVDPPFPERIAVPPPVAPPPPPPPPPRSMPVSIPGTHKPIGCHGGTPPPPFALTPTPSSLQSAASFSRTHVALTRHHMSVSPHSEPSFPSHWTPRLEAVPTGAWAPKDERQEVNSSSMLNCSHQDISPYMAFLEEDEEEGAGHHPDSADRGDHYDDEVSKFRDRMEAVSLSAGFSYCLHSDPHRNSSFSSSGTVVGGPRSVRDVCSQLQELQVDFRCAAEF